MRELIQAYKWNRRYGGQTVGLGRIDSLKNAWRWMRDWRHERADIGHTDPLNTIIRRER